MHQLTLRRPLIALPHPQRGGMYGGKSGVLGVEPGGADHSLDQIGVEEGLDRAGFRPRAGEHDSMGRVTAIDGKELPGDRLVMPLLLLPDSVVVTVLSPPGAVLIAMEALAPGAVGMEVDQLASAVSGHLENAGTGPIQHHGQQAAKLILDRRELSHQRATVHGKTGAMDQRQRTVSNSPMPFAGKDGQPLGVRQVAGVPQILLHPIEIAGDLVRNCPVQTQSGSACTADFTRFLSLIRYLPRERSLGSSLR